jgi:hypothetical protein
MLACALPREAWTHEAHLAVCLWLHAERPDFDLDIDIGPAIRAYNVTVGGVNDDHGGYHETITRAYVAGVRAYSAGSSTRDLLVLVNGLLLAPEGARDWPLRFWSRDVLFSVSARRGFVEPDLAPLPEPAS